LSRSIQDRLFYSLNSRVFYGWVIVAIGSLGIFTSGPGQSHTFSVFVTPISQDLGISSATMATAYGLATLAASLLLPRMGKIIDRYGPKKILGIIVILLGFACLFFGAAANFLMLAIGFGFLRFFGQGSLMLGCANLVSHWFNRKRGFAMSLMALGFGFSMAVHPPLSQYLIEQFGWRVAWFVLGGLTWITMLPPLILLVKDNPGEVQLEADGNRENDLKINQDQGQASISGLTLSEALQERTFYVLSFGWFGMAMLITTLHFYQVTILSSQGMSINFSAQMFTISAVSMVFFMPIVGKMFDRYRTRYIIALGMMVTALSLITITFSTTEKASILYAVIFGINNAISMTMFGYIWPRYFGRRHAGSIQGVGQMVGVFGASFGPLPVGLAIDLIGNPISTIRWLALYPIIAGVLSIIFLQAPKSLKEDSHLE